MAKQKPTPAAKAVSLPKWPTIGNVARAAADLANHIREHLPIKGEAPPPSGGPDGGPGDPAAIGLLKTWVPVHLALLKWDEQHPKPSAQVLVGNKAIEEAGALEKIRRGFDKVSCCYGLDRLAAGETVPESFPAIDLAAVLCLEWGAQKLAGTEPQPPGSTGTKSPVAPVPLATPDNPDEMVTVQTVAKRFELTEREKDRLRHRLNNWRRPSNCTEWTEPPDRRPRQCKYIYRLGSIRHLIDAVKAG